MVEALKLIGCLLIVFALISIVVGIIRWLFVTVARFAIVGLVIAGIGALVVCTFVYLWWLFVPLMVIGLVLAGVVIYKQHGDDCAEDGHSPEESAEWFDKYVEDSMKQAETAEMVVTKGDEEETKPTFEISDEEISKSSDWIDTSKRTETNPYPFFGEV